MSNGAPNDGKVVQLKDRSVPGAATGRPMGELLKRVRGTASTRLHAALRSVFDNLDDVLFDLAEKASSNAAQVEFFDGMRELRKSRPMIERRFKDQVEQNFTDFSHGSSSNVEQPEPTRTGPANLSLVGELELEESLAIAGMVAKADGRLARPLYAINQRLAMINGGAELESRDSPVGPTLVGQAFQRAMADVQIPVQIKLITYKLFERYAVAALEKLYDELNAELIRAGVLPQGAPSATPTSTGSPVSTGSAGSDDSAQHGANYADAGRAAGAEPSHAAGVEISGELFETLRALLAQRQPSTPDQPQRRRTDVATADTRELVQLLSSLQHQIVPEPAYDRSGGGVADAIRLARQVKQSLANQASRRADGSRAQVSAADEDTIDLVGMLFEFILSDRNLPSQFQAILGRLQIPYLKVAVLDKHLFAQASHPARRLLDTLARAGLSWSEESDPGHRLLDKANSVVERILQEFVDDIRIFDSERADFEQFLDRHRKRSDVAEQRVAEAANGREKLSGARQLAAAEMLKRIDGRNLPPIIHDILSRPWPNFLVLTLLHQGEESLEWRNGLRFADELVWSALPKNTPRDADRLQALLPQLERALRHGLTMIGSHADDTRRTLDELSAFYTAALAGMPVSLASVQEVIESHVASTDASGGFVAGGAFDTPQGSPVEEVIRERDRPSAPADNAAAQLEPLAEDDPYLVQTRGLKSGAWFEFKLDDGDFERAKLSWISPFTSKFLFVNRRGLKVAERSMEALARELRDGRAILLEQAPLFDRALHAVVGRLRAGASPADLGSAVLDA